MNSTAKTLAVTGGAILLFTLISKARTLGTLVFFPERIRALNFEGLAPVLTIGIMVQNTSNNGFTVKSFAGNVYFKNTLVGNVSSFNSVVINGNSQGVMLVKVKLFALSLVNEIIQIIQNGNFTGTLNLDAIANVDGLQTPVEMNFKIGA